MRLDESWTRDAWSRSPGPHKPGWAWLLLRDHGTGFVQLVLTTSPSLITAHPRADVRHYACYTEAVAARNGFGQPSLSSQAW